MKAFIQKFPSAIKGSNEFGWTPLCWMAAAEVVICVIFKSFIKFVLCEIFSPKAKPLSRSSKPSRLAELHPEAVIQCFAAQFKI